MPALEKLRVKYAPAGVRFVALSLEPDEDEVRSMLDGLGVHFTTAIATGETLAPLGVNAVPSTVFVTADGHIASALSGGQRADVLEARVRALLPDASRASELSAPR